jgi:hypothetical protein
MSSTRWSGSAERRVSSEKAPQLTATLVMPAALAAAMSNGEALEKRGRVGLVLGGVLHGDEAIYDLAEPGEGLEGHRYGEAPFGGDDGYS